MEGSGDHQYRLDASEHLASHIRASTSDQRRTSSQTHYKAFHQGTVMQFSLDSYSCQKFNRESYHVRLVVAYVGNIPMHLMAPIF